MVAVTMMNYTITYLEQVKPDDKDTPLDLPCVLTAKSGVKVSLHAWKPGITAYRKLYLEIGKPYLWYDRLVMSDAELKQILSSPDILIFRLNDGTKTIGLCELEINAAPATHNIAYFGLIPGYAEKGLGGVFMRQILARIWSCPTMPVRTTINTCTLDHPKALGFYRHLGFQDIGTKKLSVRDPRGIPELADMFV